MYTKLNAIVFTVLAGFGGAASANLVQNGGFEQTTFTGSKQLVGTDQAVNWTSNGYNFLFTPGTATTTGSESARGGFVKLWGPAVGSNNGFRDSPSGGNWIAADGAFEVSPIQQTINNLVIGQTYQLSFDWAAAQQSTYTGPTTEGWIVSLGNQSFATAMLDNPTMGFQDWRQQIFSFTATSTSEVLSFLATGTPMGNPPFSLLDNVQLNAVPEPDSLALMFAGLGVLAVSSRRRRNTPKLAA
ncbi:PEP-CTERM sorting domain-containing protein [Rhodoferax sp. WC2427]|uniref:PEP-CTERM sorting domain-containing protein n=1 Tax=Rhodoferax sp. WC2427 TaxID=3234144 RepID=UPI00346781F3